MKQILVVCALLWGVICGGAQALQLNVVDGKLVGAEDVVVGGLLFDVEFRDGTCVAVFDGCDEVSDFTFQTDEAASVAAQALLEQVFLDTAEGLFDSNPALTEGCSLFGLCFVITPFGFFFDDADNTLFVVGGFGINWVAGEDNVGTNGMYRSEDTSGLPEFVYAVWTPSVAVPVSGTLSLLFAAAFAAFAGTRGRRLQ